MPNLVREYLYSNILNLNNGDKTIKYILPQNIHLTLKFLGNTSLLKINKIKEAVKLTAAGFNKFYYSFEKTIEAFPSLKEARVIFLPLKEGGGRINDIFKVLEYNLSRIKIRKEKRKFVAHITLARLKNPSSIEKEARGIVFKNDSPVLCSSIAIFESILKPQGAEYSVIEEFELK
ncbi:MAG: RNA 2',3'-cyclic phosphodiesterase [Actinobacteria bacterium]|nr:RNA 2',3'-cyclic phosphodiesterase [Actinomycetota bacterium]